MPGHEPTPDPPSLNQAKTQANYRFTSDRRAAKSSRHYQNRRNPGVMSYPGLQSRRLVWKFVDLDDTGRGAISFWSVDAAMIAQLIVACPLPRLRQCRATAGVPIPAPPRRHRTYLSHYRCLCSSTKVASAIKLAQDDQQTNFFFCVFVFKNFSLMELLRFVLA